MNRKLIVGCAAVLAFAGAMQAQGKGHGAGGGKADKSHGQGANVRAYQAKPGQGAANQDKGQARGRSSEHAQAKVTPRAQVGQGRDEAPDRSAEHKAKGNEKAEAHGLETESRGDVARGLGAHGAPGHGEFHRTLVLDEVHPVARRFVTSDRPAERVAGRAVAFALARGVGPNTLLITPNGRAVIVRNRHGDDLLDLDEDRARDLGVWRVIPLDDRVENGAPSFCRSGAGHPVWGRQWCLDKGFGLGPYNNVRWGRLDHPDGIIFHEVAGPMLAPAVLRTAIGDVAYDRLAVHALTLGLTDPLTGRWLGETTGPRVLLLTSGPVPVAEVIDLDRDGRADRLVVALRPW